MQMSDIYIKVAPKTLVCVEVGFIDEEQIADAVRDGFVIIPATIKGARHVFGVKFDSLDHAYREASKQ